jgi:hypothetical protein
MAVDIIRYVDASDDQIIEAVVSGIVPREGELVELGGQTYQATDVIYRVARRVDDFLDRDDKVHIAIVSLEHIEYQDNAPPEANDE